MTHPGRPVARATPRLNRRQALAAVAATVALPGLAWAAEPAGFRTVRWEELVPKDWDPLKHFKDKQVANVREGSANELAMMREMRELWDNAPTRADLDGAKLRLPGYVVPLENRKGELKEFLLVPYFGACIHSPPPPANQIVHVHLATPKAWRTMDTVWVSGTLLTRRDDSPFGSSGYRMQDALAEVYTPPPGAR